MDVGVVLTRALTPDPAAWVRTARAAESLGCHSIWTNEHIAIPGRIESRYPYSPDGAPTFKIDTGWYEAMVALAFLAGVTDRIRLGTAVVPLFGGDYNVTTSDLTGGVPSNRLLVTWTDGRNLLSPPRAGAASPGRLPGLRGYAHPPGHAHAGPVDEPPMASSLQMLLLVARAAAAAP